MRNVFVQSATKGWFAEQNQSAQARFFHKAYPPFGECVQIGSAPWKPQWFHASGAQSGSEPGAELRIAVMQQIALVDKSADAGVGQITGGLLHPLVVRMRGHAGQRQPPCLQMDRKQNVVRGQTAPRDHLCREEVHACEKPPHGTL